MVQLDGLQTEGIFRVSGSSDEADRLLTALRAAATADEVAGVLATCDDCHDCALVLCRWLRGQNELIPASFYASCGNVWGAALFAAAQDGRAEDGRKAAEEFVSELPQPGQALLRAVVAHLQRVSRNADKTKMSATNLGRVFAPLFLKRTDASPEELLRHAGSDATFVAALVDWLETAQGERPEAEELEPEPVRPVSVEVLKTSQGFGMRETDPAPSQGQRAELTA